MPDQDSVTVKVFVLPNPAKPPPPEPVDRFSKLPPEILDQIFSLLPMSTWSGRVKPISQGLWPLQRRRLVSLRLPKAADPVERYRRILSSVDHLERLTIFADDHVGTLLSFLPHPERLRDLYVCGGSFPSKPAAISAFSSFTSLDTLAVKCAFPFRHPSMDRALRVLPLETLIVEEKSTASYEDLLPLVEHSTKHPSLKTLELEHVYSEPYGDAIEGWDYDSGWTLPQWPDYLGRDNVESLIQEGECSGIAVRGSAVEAIEVEDEYEEGKELYARVQAEQAERYDRKRHPRRYRYPEDFEEEEEEEWY
ncbi:hypothetical protein JCM10213_000331 [Rhodosporidiobolus nylandii]